MEVITQLDMDRSPNIHNTTGIACAAMGPPKTRPVVPSNQAMGPHREAQAQRRSTGRRIVPTWQWVWGRWTALFGDLQGIPVPSALGDHIGRHALEDWSMKSAGDETFWFGGGGGRGQTWRHKSQAKAGQTHEIPANTERKPQAGSKPGKRWEKLEKSWRKAGQKQGKSCSRGEGTCKARNGRVHEQALKGKVGLSYFMHELILSFQPCGTLEGVARAPRTLRHSSIPGFVPCWTT